MKRKILLIISFLICSVVSLYAGEEMWPWSLITQNGAQVEFNTTTRKLNILSAGTNTQYTVPGKLTYTDGKVYQIDTVEIKDQPSTSPLTSVRFWGSYLKAVICTNNPSITTVDISAQTQKNAIKYFDFSDCTNLASITNIGDAVEYLNVNGCLSLKILSCKNNRIENLDVSTCQSLQHLNCNGCTNLKSITLPSNKGTLETVNVSDCSSLESLNLQDYTNITDISVSGCESLTNLVLPSNNTNIRSLKFIKIAQKTLDVKGYLNLDTLICDSSDVIETIEVPNSLKYIRIVNLSRMGQINLSNCSKLTFLNHENTRLHEPGIDQCTNLLWYINADGYLVNNPARTYHYIHKGNWGTLCWPERISSDNMEAYNVIGAEFDGEYITGIYLEKVIDSDQYNVNQGITTLEAGKPYILKYLNDTIKFRRERNTTFVDTPIEAVGLIGTYQELKLNYNSSADIAIIKSGILWEVDAEYSIPGFSSYVNLLALPTNVTSDIYIELNSDGIQNLKNHIDKQDTESELVDVYSIHGVKVRNDVNAEDATTGLPRGAYIVNGKIVIK